MAGYDGMNGEFTSRLQAMQNAARAAGFDVSITSGYRSPERQQQLWDAALKKYGDPEIADNWVARPGKSNHGKGIAADLGFSNAAARQWAHANAARFGLHFPMEWEPWHVEPVGIQASSDPGAYTTPPAGYGNPTDLVADPHDLGTQFQNFLGSMTLGDMMGAEIVAAAPKVGGPEPLEGVSGQPEDQAAAVASALTGDMT